MPPNLKGGKNYKKGKKGGQESAADLYIERTEGQLVGRVTRILGNRNMLVYCNDNKLRICRVCGKMKGRVWVEAGDVVLCSLRDFATDANRGDIVGKYPAEMHSRLRKEEGVNLKIFMKLETMNGLTPDNIGTVKLESFAEEDAIIFDEDAPGEESEELDMDKI